MIASNYIKHPEALRYQMELFSKGYKNSPRIMRLIEVIFKQTTTMPDWVKKAHRKAKELVKKWKKTQLEINFKKLEKCDLANRLSDCAGSRSELYGPLKNA